ncbi:MULTISPECIES: hypothetical protein [unclassified Burkholderia]|uniref:hypothetical protein n=1 Tax=unclassified Burkholderia TaxID=2613784 RepID=UPI00141E9C8B|nr:MULTISPECIES: hypothetical protein [unclassified Burkholderia]NIE81828.1 hypothetical protein [Burkholderia sp. Tr-860]NIF64829.1 hypothetical protein [Burkholderia sp. Cy-647]NIF93919.1 hypothetical protein [Burkholderia sp. Ax-1720]
MDNHQDKQVREAVARAICSACGEKPEHIGDARGSAFRWQEYECLAQAVLTELQAAETDEPGRSSISHLAKVIARSCEDGADQAWMYERAAGDAMRAYIGRGSGQGR